MQRQGKDDNKPRPEQKTKAWVPNQRTGSTNYQRRTTAREPGRPGRNIQNKKVSDNNRESKQEEASRAAQKTAARSKTSGGQPGRHHNKPGCLRATRGLPQCPFPSQLKPR